jgi:glycosyltransferase involved in cell wall biosynthesis
MGVSRMDTISVVIPVFNRANLLPATLRSLLAQTVPAEEIIVVDDGSTDSTVEVAESFGPPVRVLRRINGGPGAARNTGFLASQGDFIHFFDSDDIALPNKHEVHLKALIKSGADIAFGPWVKGRISEHEFVPEGQVLQQNGLPRGDLVKALLTDWSVVPHACLFRREIVDRVGGFPEELFGTEDQLMFLRCLLAGGRVVHSAGTLELYRTNDPGKITASNESSKARHFIECAKFLIMGRNECLVKGIDPVKWSGYRQRLWAAARDLSSLAGQAGIETLRDQLLKILGKRGTHSYPIRAWLRQKFGGLQQRLIGRRGSSSLRMGPMTKDQWALTNKAIALTQSPNS